MGQLTCRYPTQQVIGDYARAGLGTGLTGLPASVLPMSSWAFFLFAGCSVLFVLLGVHTLIRHRSRIVLTDEAIELRPRRVRIRWGDLTELELSYFSTRRDRREGWLQLVLRADDGTIRLDSRLDGFHEVVERAARSAARRSLVLSSATSSNLDAIGIRGGASTRERSPLHGR